MKTEKPSNQAKSGSEGKEATAFERASTSDFSAHVFDQTKVFLRSAQARELSFLIYLLEMVAVEAARLRDGGS